MSAFDIFCVPLALAGKSPEYFSLVLPYLSLSTSTTQQSHATMPPFPLHAAITWSSLSHLLLPFVQPSAGWVAALLHPRTAHAPSASSALSVSRLCSSPALHAAFVLLLSPVTFFTFLPLPAAGSPLLCGRSACPYCLSFSSLVVLVATPSSPCPCCLCCTLSLSSRTATFLCLALSFLTVSCASSRVIPARTLSLTRSSPSRRILYLALRSSSAFLGRPLAFPVGACFHSLLLTAIFLCAMPRSSSHLCCASFLASHMSRPASASTFAEAMTSFTSPRSTLPRTSFGTSPIQPHHLCQAPHPG